MRHINTLYTIMLKQMKILFLTSFFTNLKLLVSTSTASGMFLTKLSATFKLAVFLSPIPILAGLGKWSDANSIYINLVSGAIIMDWVLGTFKHWLWIKDFHWLENIKGLLVKTFLVLAMGFVVEGLDYLTHDISIVAENLVVILRLTVFMYPAMSIIRSSRILSEGRFPPQKIYDMIENWTEGVGKKTKSKI